MAEAATQVSVDGHRLRLTNLDKVMYPETGTTKQDVLRYYAEVAEWLLPHAEGRPVTRKRWVNGVDGPMFFQKNLEEHAPSWVKHHRIEHKDHANDYPLVENTATLVWLAQLGALELHVPQWRFGPRGARRDPDRLVLDLDPGEGAGLPECVEVAKLARTILRDIGLDPLPVTSGSKGIHLYAGLDGSMTSEQVSALAHELARALEADHPDLVVSDMKKTLRRGKVLVDWSQNNGNKTTILPYSLRGRARPTVAAPRTWRELARTDLRQLEYTEVLERLRRRGDPLAQLHGDRPDGDLSGGAAERGRRDTPALERYRAKRDPSLTPEPFGDAAHRERGGDAPIFVIQEHHASRLHWDFRLEHDGVLVSWALPKGVPTEPGRNHLAVQTEDHPMDYAGFHGDIPHGEYGAGHVEIWDEGTFELEKWKEKEVIVTLHGRRGDPRYALIRTGDDQWLIHLMKDQRPGHWSSGAGRRDAAPARRPADASRAPMLATAGSADAIRADERDAWAYEMKWDGVRALAVVVDGAVTLRSRNGLDLTPTFPELAALGASVEGSAVLDGEIVALDSRGRPSFSRLQQRLGLTSARDVERARAEVGAAILLFDVLEHDGEDLTGRTYLERRAELQRIVRPAGVVQVPGDAGDDLDDAIASSRELGLEGVMAKRRESRYREGRRSADWIKIKHTSTQEVVVVGWTDGTGHRSNTLGALLLAIPEDGGELRYAGKVGTGFRDRDLVDARRTLDPLSRKTAPVDGVPAPEARRAHWVRPTLVGEVEYAERTRDGRLRAPVWRGWRPDKDPDQVVVEPPAGA